MARASLHAPPMAGLPYSDVIMLANAVLLCHDVTELGQWSRVLGWGATFERWGRWRPVAAARAPAPLCPPHTETLQHNTDLNPQAGQSQPPPAALNSPNNEALCLTTTPLLEK
ncbi:hypothetical protein E2C01_035417 [Portunus trituberculatus]|uniref:Uncharacterized protein n=1 Tax=Portunus trituberculatus TaxID=210409 RepID=A0A5B7F453_PORTR|nr:hypothetical protein [Portunus trituberculatus]